MLDNKEDLLVQIGTTREKNSFHAQNFIAEKETWIACTFSHAEKICSTRSNRRGKSSLVEMMNKILVSPHQLPLR